MPERKSKEDVNEVAARIAAFVRDYAEEPPSDTQENRKKNPAAVELGRLGGLKGGRARARRLSKKKRSEIARKAAQARWSKKGDEA